MDASEVPLPLQTMNYVSGDNGVVLTIVEYGCYQCPHSGQAHQLIRLIQQRLGHQLHLIFRHFPQIDLYPQAQKAAEAVEAAAAQGKFWQMHDLLFERQPALSDGDLVEYAAELGLEMSNFLRDISEHVYEQKVRADLFGGIRMGVVCTPTLFINGIRQDGEISLLQLLTVLINACDIPLDKKSDRYLDHVS